MGETTRVLLRRVPWKILVDAPDRPEHDHIRLLAAQRRPRRSSARTGVLVCRTDQGEHQNDRALTATDLDRTMIFSKAAMGPEQFGRLDLRCVGSTRTPLSFMTADAVDLLDALAAAAPVVPVTTRTPKQYRRIALPGRPFRYAVVSSGGRIITDGADDKSWRAHIDSQLSGAGADLGTVVAELESRIDQAWVKKFRIADELFCYIVVRTERQPAGFLADWTGWCAERGWTVSQQGRKIYAQPATVTKSAALAEVRRRLIDDGTPWPRRRPCSPPVTDCSTPTCSGRGPRDPARARRTARTGLPARPRARNRDGRRAGR